VSAEVDSHRVAAIVLNWNGWADTCVAVESLLVQTFAQLEIHVVDNGSDGDEAGRLRAKFGDRITVHENEANLGFTGGHNRLMSELLAGGEIDYIALLNSDAEAEPDWIEVMVRAAGRYRDVGAIASLMVFKNRPDAVENAGVLMLRTGEAIPRGRGGPVGDWQVESDVLGACGGAVLYRAESLRQVGVFREDFFLNFEDVDLSLRLVAAGWGCRFVPAAVVRHGLSRSIDRVRDAAFAARSIRNMSFAYLVNMPALVLAIGLPWLFVSWVLAPLACLVVLQFGYARALVRGRLQTLRQWREVVAARRRLRPLRRGSAWRVWWLHGSTVLAYLRFLRDVVVMRRRAAFR